MFFSMMQRCSKKTCSKSMNLFLEDVELPGSAASYFVQCPSCQSNIEFSIHDLVQVETVPIGAIFAKRSLLKSILIGDDEADLRDTLSTLLSLARFRVRTCASREDALLMLSQDVPDLIIADWYMPGMMLETFVETVRKQYVTLLVVLFSSAESAPQMAESLSIPYISKSVDPDELISKIQRMVN